jgi:ketosteroid isomerase-like protein
MWKTGKPFSVPGVSVIDVENGRISRNLDYYDMATVMRQVGVLPKH